MRIYFYEIFLCVDEFYKHLKNFERYLRKWGFYMGLFNDILWYKFIWVDSYYVPNLKIEYMLVCDFWYSYLCQVLLCIFLFSSLVLFSFFFFPSFYQVPSFLTSDLTNYYYVTHALVVMVALRVRRVRKYPLCFSLHLHICCELFFFFFLMLKS